MSWESHWSTSQCLCFLTYLGLTWTSGGILLQAETSLNELEKKETSPIRNFIQQVKWFGMVPFWAIAFLMGVILFKWSIGNLTWSNCQNFVIIIEWKPCISYRKLKQRKSMWMSLIKRNALHFLPCLLEVWGLAPPHLWILLVFPYHRNIVRRP